MNDWLDLAKGPVTRDELQAFVEGNGIRVEETVKGKPDTSRPMVVAI